MQFEWVNVLKNHFLRLFGRNLDRTLEKTSIWNALKGNARHEGITDIIAPQDGGKFSSDRGLGCFLFMLNLVLIGKDISGESLPF